MGPHLIVAPLSTLSNWINEFKKWTPSIPVVLYHGTPQERAQIWRTGVSKHLQNNRPTETFPVVCTSYEILLREKATLGKVNWGFIIIVRVASNVAMLGDNPLIIAGRGPSHEEL